MYCSVEGSVSPCWLTIDACDHWSETRSLKNIWFGENFQRWRERGCCSLDKAFTDKLTDFTIAPVYESNQVKEYPSMLELELSNQCNFECIMCDERLSSGIRKRKGLAPLPMAYSDKFVDDVEEMLPHVDEIRLKGGEPFSMKLAFDIIDRVNDGTEINIATNGSILNKRVQEVIKNKNISINLSLDALTKELFEKIRINSNFDTIMKNFYEFKKYCDVRVIVCPMTINWHEMINFVDFCNEHSVHLGFNTVRYPKHLSIEHMDVDMIEEVFFTMFKQMNAYSYKNYNWKKFEYLVNTQIRKWMTDKWEKSE